MKKAALFLGLVAGLGGCNGAIVGGDGSALQAGAGGVGADSLPAGGDTSARDNPAPAGGRPPSEEGGNHFAGASIVSSAGGSSAGGSSAGSGGTAEDGASCSSTIDAWIAFDSDAADFNRDLYLIRPDGSRRTRLTTDVSVEREPYFSPDGGSLSFTSDRDGSMQIYVMDLATRAVTQVSHRQEGADSSSFSADSQLIAFHSGASVYVIKPDGSEETLVATGLDDFNAYFAPRFIGSDQLVFDRNNEIDAVRVDGANFRNVIGNWTISIKAPTVSPQGNEIAYAAQCGVGANPDPGHGIWTASATVSSQVCTGRRVTPVGDGFSNESPAWGPDNTFAYQRLDIASNISRITLIRRAQGSTPCSLTGPNEDARNANWSAVGLEL
jgi:dipeptidyl aminopeptidase/acylaminoacyl peptidase